MGQAPTRQLQRIRRLIRQGRRKHAGRALRRLLTRVPNQPEAWFELGHLSEGPQAEQRLTALGWYRRASYFNPRLPQVWYRMGLLYEQSSLFRDAIFAFGAYLRLRPESTSQHVYLHLAQALSRLKYEGSAVQFYLKALEAEQSNPLILFSLSQSLQKLGDLDLALDSLMALGRLYPAKLDLVSLLMGNLLEKQGESIAARQCYDEALRRQPRQLFWQLKRDLVYPLIPENRADIETSAAGIEAALAQALDRLRHQPVQLPHEHFFYLAMMHGNIAYTAYHHTDALRQRQLLAELIRRSLAKPPAWQPSVSGPRLHLGIIAAAKSVALSFIYTSAMADRLDPARFQVTIFCQSPDVAQLFKSSSRYHFHGSHVSWKLISDDPHQALAQVRASRLDAMFFTEPGWDFQQYILALFRVAPVQCTSWMNPGTSGIATMDYFLSAAMMEPTGSENQYSEHLERWRAFPSWVPAFDFPAPAPREDFGLADGWHLYACLQNLLKVHPDLDLLIGEILRRDPQGRLLMVSTPERQHLTGLLMQRFARRIPDVMERIWVFPELSNQEFLQLLLNCDVVLDPLYYGGGTTTYQALAAGLPIVTLPGERMVGRITEALCRKVGAIEGIVNSENEYVERALALAADPAWRATIVKRTRAQAHLIYEDDEAVACFAEFLERAVGSA